MGMECVPGGGAAQLKLCDTTTGQPFYTGLTFVSIELPKFQTALDAEPGQLAADTAAG